MPVTAEIECDDVEAVDQPLLCEAPEPPAVGGDPVEADDRRRAGRAPFVDVELHSPRSKMRS
jgi:hypothetical protein